MAAYIWGYQISVGNIRQLLEYPFIGRGSQAEISVVVVLQLLGFFLLGLLIAHALNRFVFRRIFDLLLVDPGAQHTVTSLARYIVVLTTTFIGFNRVGLGQPIGILIGAIAFGLVWSLKDPVANFIAYFIILVQRPVKIGDYINADPNITGVVRKITAQSTILRRKNSTTIVVSNAHLLGRYIINWNYTRNFIAFDDIHICVDYDADPAVVRGLLQEAVEAHPDVLRNPKPVIRLEEFSDYGYTFMVRGFVSSVYTLEQWNIASDVRFNIVAKLREHDVKLAVPIRMLVGRNQEPFTVGKEK